MSTDRTAIAPLLVPFFPTMAKYTETVIVGTDEEGNPIKQTIVHPTSDEWHGFLNAKTGLNISPYEPNGSAFDKWRQALALQEYPVWPYTAAQMTAMQQRGQELKAAEDARVEAQPATLALLSKEAPTKTAADLIKDAKRAIFG